MTNKIALLAIVTTLALAISGCAKEEGPMEKMGESLDDAAESVEESAKEAADSVKEAVED